MWIASGLGYFSIVNKDGKYYVRARSVNDLELLKKATGLSNKVLQFQGTDYIARIIVDKKDLNIIKDALFESIVYPNFKNSIHANKNQSDKSDFYGRIWGVMFQYQQEQER